MYCRYHFVAGKWREHQRVNIASVIFNFDELNSYLAAYKNVFFIMIAVFLVQTDILVRVK